MFMRVDNVREMTVKKSCKYDEYGSFYHLLFLFFNRKSPSTFLYLDYLSSAMISHSFVVVVVNVVIVILCNRMVS